MLSAQVKIYKLDSTRR